MNPGQEGSSWLGSNEPLFGSQPPIDLTMGGHGYPGDGGVNSTSNYNIPPSTGLAGNMYSGQTGPSVLPPPPASSALEQNPTVPPPPPSNISLNQPNAAVQQNPVTQERQHIQPRPVLDQDYYANLDITSAYLGPTYLPTDQGMSSRQETTQRPATTGQMGQSSTYTASTAGATSNRQQSQQMTTTPAHNISTGSTTLLFRPSDQPQGVTVVTSGSSGTSGHNQICRLSHNRLFFDGQFSHKKSIPIGMVVQPLAIPYSYTNDDITKAWLGEDGAGVPKEKVSKRVPVVRFKNGIIRCPRCLAFASCYSTFVISPNNTATNGFIYNNESMKTINPDKCHVSMKCVICGQVTRVGSDYRERVIGALNNCRDKSLLLLNQSDEFNDEMKVDGVSVLARAVDKPLEHAGINDEGKTLHILNPFKDALELQYGTYDINIGSTMYSESRKDFNSVPVESYEIRHNQAVDGGDKVLRKIVKATNLPEKPSFVFIIDAYAYSIYNGCALSGVSETVHKKANKNIVFAQLAALYNALKRLQASFNHEVSELARVMDVADVTELLFTVVLISREGIHLFEPVYDECFNVVQLREVILQPTETTHIPLRKKFGTNGTDEKDTGETFNFFFRLSSYKNVVDSLYEHIETLGSSGKRRGGVGSGVGASGSGGVSTDPFTIIPQSPKPPASLIPSALSISEMLMTGEYVDREISRFTNPESKKENKQLPTYEDDDIPYHSIICNTSGGSSPCPSTPSMQVYQKRKFGRIVMFATLSSSSTIEVVSNAVNVDRASQKMKASMKSIGLYASRHGVTISGYVLDNITAVGNSFNSPLPLPHNMMDISVVPMETATFISGGKLRYDPSFHQQWCQVPEISKDSIYQDYDGVFCECCQTTSNYPIKNKKENRLNETVNGVTPAERERAFNTVLFAPNNPLIRFVLDVCSHFGASPTTSEFKVDTSDIDMVSFPPCSTGYDTIFRVRASPIPTYNSTSTAAVAEESNDPNAKQFQMSFLGPLLMRTSDLCATGLMEFDNTVSVVLKGFKSEGPSGGNTNSDEAAGAPIKPVFIQSSLIYSTLLGFRRIRVDTRRISVYRSSYGYNNSNMSSSGYSIASNIGNQYCLSTDIDVLLSVLTKMVVGGWMNEEGISAPDTSTNTETIINILEDIKKPGLKALAKVKKTTTTTTTSHYSTGKDTYRSLPRSIIQYVSNTCNDAFNSNINGMYNGGGSQLPKELALLPIYSFCLAKHLKKDCCSETPAEKGEETISLASLLELSGFVSAICWCNSHRIRCLIYPRIYPIPYIIVKDSDVDPSGGGERAKEVGSSQTAVFPRVLRLSNKRIRNASQDFPKDKTMYVNSGLFMVEGNKGLYLGRISGCDPTLPEGLTSANVAVNMKMVAQLTQYVRRSRGKHIPIWPLRSRNQAGGSSHPSTTLFSDWGQIPGKYLIEDGVVCGGEGSSMEDWTTWLNGEISKL